MMHFRHYEEQFRGLTFRFEFIRFAFTSLSKAKRESFIKQCRDRDFSAINQRSAGFESRPEVVEFFGAEQAKKIAKETADYSKRKVRGQYRISDLRFHEEQIEDRINQSELLLMVAYFESFLKEFHAKILHADPKLIAVTLEKENDKKENDNQEVKVLLKKVFEGEFKYFLRGEITKTVKKWDQQKIEERAKRFKKISIDFGDDSKVQKLKAIFGFRNRISHEMSFAPTSRNSRSESELDEDDETSAGTIVPSNVMSDARTLLLAIPRSCIDQAIERFPSRFSRT